MTTGQRVLYREGYTAVCIGTDNGHYEGTRDDLNVRRICNSVTLDNLKLTDPAIISIMSGDGYGCGWGSASELYPITAAQEAALTAANDAILTQDAPTTTRSNKDICPICGGYCYGDCQAAK